MAQGTLHDLSPSLAFHNNNVHEFKYSRAFLRRMTHYFKPRYLHISLFSRWTFCGSHDIWAIKIFSTCFRIRMHQPKTGRWKYRKYSFHDWLAGGILMFFTSVAKTNIWNERGITTSKLNPMYETSGSLERQEFYKFKWKEEEKEELEEEEEAGSQYLQHITYLLLLNISSGHS